MLTGPTVLMTSSVARTTSSNETNTVRLPQSASGVDLVLNVTSLTGNAATLIVVIQKGWIDLSSTDGVIGNGTTGVENWMDFATFATVSTSTAFQYLPLVQTMTSTKAITITQGSMAPNTQVSGIPGDLFRVAWNVGGTTPVASFSVVASFYY